ncbi:alkaline phosphatase family protein [Novosphingobium sp.]|uniref:alkaline phosphatase family protein n=1 Tax=Novosphingobium sp. TaxID=1874826 RepID=UPI001DA17FB3|nr:alkaline phosphatase family protein [Novosphingobium sp.]MBX9662321.1 alkaline phosphatase family protein [Novosphingobium sp.]
MALRRFRSFTLGAAALAAVIALPHYGLARPAAKRAPAPAAAPAVQPAANAPKLIVAISIDQFSADLFAQYRSHFTGGLARLATGAVFPAGYQSHAATETCPGHSTILTGVHPARTGIIANTWIDQSALRSKKQVYCAEDENQTAADPKDYVASVSHLLVPTLGERIKALWPASRNVAVSGKDRGALMMGGHVIDSVYWWKGAGFATLDGRALTPAAVNENKALGEVLAQGAPELPLPEWCKGKDRAVPLSATFAVGTGRFAMAAGDRNAFRASPRLDRATLDLATELVDENKLGKGATPDVLSVSLSATDYVGHGYGTEGAEMCIQLQQLDLALGDFFIALDSRGIDYAVVLTADHGGFDMPERLGEQALPASHRVSKALLPEALSAAVAAKTGLDAKGLVLSDGPSGDIWLRRDLAPADKARALEALKAELVANPDVAAAFTADEIAAAPVGTGSPETWPLIARAKASFYPPRSGDLVLMLKRGVVPIPVPGPGYVATHGSPWDYDRRVPMLFWRKGMTGFEQPSPVETVDIAPTLAALIGLPVPAGAFDGRCLDLDAGSGDTCGATK